MSTSNYEGPRGGDYARYVDELLRASPLPQALVQRAGAQQFIDVARIVAAAGAFVIGR